jgi:hypothetical protein
MNETGKLPFSAALAEASEESLSELFSRDPESFTKQDIAVIVLELRAKALVWAKAEAEGKKSAPRSLTPKANALISKKSVDDLGL